MMRRSFSVLALSWLLAAAACPPKPDEAPKHKVPDSRSSVLNRPHETEDKRPDVLRGEKISKHQDGPWAVRTTLFTQEEKGTFGVADSEMESGVAAFASKPMDAYAEAPAPRSESMARKRSLSPSTSSGAAGIGAMKMSEATPAARHAMPHQPPQGQLRAGSTDDNKDFDAFLQYLSPFAERSDTKDRIYALDVRERRSIDVVDKEGRPLPGAWVDIVDSKTEKALWSGTTYGDGRLPFFPLIRDPENASEAWLVNVRHGDFNQHIVWEKDDANLRVVLDTEMHNKSQNVPLDVLFLVDTTGSMSDEIQRIKDTLATVTQKAHENGRAIDLRYGAVLYRDIGDEYLTRTHPFTTNVAEFETALRSVQAGGGGDGPESLNQGLAESIHGVKWRPQAAKVAFLIADAPPHLDYPEDVPYWDSAIDAVARGIRIHAVAASGLDNMGTLCFRQIAQLSRGKFIFIEYGSVSAAAASHGVTGEVKSNNLDDIIYDEIAWEIDHYGVAPTQG